MSSYFFMNFLVILSISILSLGVLNPIHFSPISTLLSEIIFILGFLLYSFIFSVKSKKLRFPLILMCFFLLLFFFINIFEFLYLLVAFIAVMVGFNFNEEKKIKKLMAVILLVGLFNVYVAIIQWLNLSEGMFFSKMIGNRPYANFNQPNNLSTFLLLSFISLLYLYEKRAINSLILAISSFILLWGITLTQSRTAWVCVLFIIAYIFIQNKKKNLFNFNSKKVVEFSILFIVMVISLPYVNKILVPYYGVVQVNTVIERVNNGHERLQIWSNFIYAIFQKPLVGYGWGNTTKAQYEIAEKFNGIGWAHSAHNIIIDIFLWCGIPVGLIFFIFIFILYLKVLSNTKSLEVYFSVLMISIILIHSMFEYPLHYAYFLLPFAFFSGICLSELNLNKIDINHKWSCLLIIIGLLILAQLFKEYDQITDNIVAANTHEMNELKTEIELPYDSLFFDKYEDRARWIAQYPYMQVNQNVLDLAERNLNSFLTPYDLYKYAILLAHNGHKEMAERQLKILKIMYGIDHSYESLFVKTQIVEISSEN